MTDEIGARCLLPRVRWLPGLLIGAVLGLGLGACGSAEPTTASSRTAGATSITAAVAATGSTPTEVPANPTITTTAATTTTTTTAATTTTTTSTAAPDPDPLPSQELSIPLQPPPTIDGILTPGEWDGAVSGEMSNGTPVYAMHDGESLYVAVAGEHLGAVNVAIGGPDDIWILHSSAALGSMRYDVDGALLHDFDWCCRSPDDPAGRLALLEAEGWQANIGYTGEPGIVEYQVARPRVATAVAIAARTEAADPSFWPPDLTPEARAQLIAPWPSRQTFRMVEWVRLVTREG